MTDEELKQILKLAQNGDSLAFGRIYDQFSVKIYRFIYFRIGHKEVAEDVLSDTFVKAWQKINQINTPEALSGWLYQIARNNVIDYYRIKKDTISLEDISETLVDLASPIDALNAGMQQKKILNVMDQLTLEQQEVVKYKFFEDLTNQEIADVMNKTEGAIRVLQHRAVNKLKELLSKKNESI